MNNNYKFFQKIKNKVKALTFLTLITLTVVFNIIPSNCSKANMKIVDKHNSFQRPNTVSPKNIEKNINESPAGVSKEWLNSLRDETGNRIIMEDQRADTLRTKLFVGSSGGFGHDVNSAGDVNGDGFSDIIVGASLGYYGNAYIYLGSSNMNSFPDVILIGENIFDFFGTSVSSAGDVNGDGYSDIIVGANGYNSYMGRAYIFFGGQQMNNTADVIMTGESTNNYFGISVSTAGDVNNDGYSDVTVGAYAVDKAYVYFGGASMDNIVDVTMAGALYSGFGYSVSGGDVNHDGYDDVIVSSNSRNAVNNGKAHIYFGGASMDNIADLSMTGEDYSFGYSGSVAGDLNNDGYADVIIGAVGIGKVYIYFGGGVMDSIPDLSMTNQQYNLGYSVSAAGDVNNDGYSDVIVGGWEKAFIYFGGTVMDSIADETMTGDPQSFFGTSVSKAGDVNNDGYDDVIVGDYGNSNYTGSAYLFGYFLKGDLNADAFLTENLPEYNLYGYSVSSAGDVNHDGFDDVIVGAYQYSDGTGRAYIYFGGTSMDNIADVTITGEAGAYSSFGYSVSSAGDVNSDGYSDVIVGAYVFNSYTGRAYIYYGGALMNNVADVTVTGDAYYSFFGNSVSSAGDVNGDGYSDVIVGAFGNNSSTGKASIYFGGVSMDNVDDVTLNGESSSNNFGYSVSTAGDVNGDGSSDVIVGAYQYSNGTGRAYIYFGGAVMNNTSDVTLTGETDYTYFGLSVSTAGDVNGDGYADIIVGSTEYAKAYLYFGGAPMNNIADITMIAEATSTYFGSLVSSGGDVNKDGYSDVIVGAYGYYTGTGRTYIYFGGTSMDNEADLTMSGEAKNDNFGLSAASAGDINGDGYSDVIVGAPGFNSSSGKAYIYRGSAISSVTDITLNLKMFVEGFYNSVSNSQIGDTIKAYLRNTVSPFSKVDSAKSVVTSSGNLDVKFSNAPTGTYYIELTHRNSIETWSSSGIPCTLGSSVSYDFTNAASKAFGNNLKLVASSPSRYAIYSGDVNQDGYIDLTDINLVYNDASSFAAGYIKTDLTGDNIIDLTDILIAYNNSSNFVSVIRP